jgi:aldose 1-epimerase
MMIWGTGCGGVGVGLGAGFGRMAGMVIPLTGTQYEISGGGYSAVVTELGAGLRALRRGDRALITSYEANHLPPAGSGQLLAPWPNRVDGGHYTFGGQALQLDLSEPAAGNAIHGLTRWANWVVEDQGPSHVRLGHVLHGRTGYPFVLHLQAEYRLGDEGLHVEVAARNLGDSQLPYGTGNHPYLTVGTPFIDECQLTLPATRWQPIGNRGIPAGPEEDVAGAEVDFRQPRALGDIHLDHAFTGLERGADGRAWVTLAGPEHTVRMWAGEGYEWLQVFTGDPLDDDHRRRALAVEPMTCPPNAFVSGTDLITLAPGDETRHAWGIVSAGS